MTNPSIRAELESALIEKAAGDEAFRAQLTQDPRAAIAALGVQIPAELEIQVFQETADRLCLVLPAVAETELSDDDLEGVAGGRMARRYSKEELEQTDPNLHDNPGH